MSIWHKEVVRVNGRLMAYVEVQNEYTGAIKRGLRDIHVDGNNYYCEADSQHVDLTYERNKYVLSEQKTERALKICKDNNYI